MNQTSTIPADAIESAIATLNELAPKIDALEIPVEARRQYLLRHLSNLSEIGAALKSDQSDAKRFFKPDPYSDLENARQRAGEVGEMLAIQADHLSQEVERLKGDGLMLVRTGVLKTLEATFDDNARAVLPLTKAIRREVTFSDNHGVRPWGARIRALCDATGITDSRNIAQLIIKEFEGATALHAEVKTHFGEVQTQYSKPTKSAA